MAVSVPIVADYDPSGVDRAKSSFGDLSRSVGKAFAEVRKASKEALGGLEEGLEDSRTAGQKLAAQLSTAAGKINADLQASRRAADALGEALGPDMAASLGRNGLDRMVRDLQRAGLTLQDIETDAKSLGDALRQLDETNLGRVAPQADQTAGAMRRVGDEADRSKSVMANFTGNALQELPMMTGAFGPLTMAMGQFAEYAVEGGVALQGFALSLAPILAGSVVVAGIANDFRKSAEAQRFNAEQTAELVKQLGQGKLLAEGIRDAILETREIEFFKGGERDLVPTLAKLNLQLDDYLTLVDMAPEKFEKWIQGTYGVQAAASDELKFIDELAAKSWELYGNRAYLVDLYTAVTDAHNNAANAAARHATETQVFTASLDYTATELAAVANAAQTTALGFQSTGREAVQATPGVDTLSVLFGTTAIKAGNAADETARWNLELKRLKDELDLEDAFDAVDDSLKNAEEAQKALVEAAKKGGKEYEDALENMSDSTRDAKQRVLEYQDALDLPPEVVTKFLAEIDAGAADKVRRELDLIAKLRTATFEPRTTTNDGRNGQKPMARGGPVTAQQTYLVGEVGPELFVPNVSGTIIPNNQLPSLNTTQGTAVGGAVYNTFNISGAIDPVATAYQIRDILQFDADRRGSSNLLGV